MDIVEIKRADGKYVQSSDILKSIKSRYGITGLVDFTNTDTGINVDVRADGINETIHRTGKSSTRISALYNIGDVIQNGIYVGSQVNYNPDGSNNTIHNFVTPMMYDGEMYRAEFNVREITGGKGTQDKFYFERISKLDMTKRMDSASMQVRSQNNRPQHLGASNPSANNSIVTSGENVNTISINDLLAGYNLSDKKMWPLMKQVQDSGGNTGSKAAANALCLF